MFSIYFLIQLSPISNIILCFSAVERENPNRLFIRQATEGELSSEAIIKIACNGALYSHNSAQRGSGKLWLAN